MGAINYTITSTFGYVNSTGTIIGPVTYFKTIFDFQSNQSDFVATTSKLLAVSTVTAFTCFPNQYSDAQTVYFYNNEIQPMLDLLEHRRNRRRRSYTADPTLASAMLGAVASNYLKKLSEEKPEDNINAV